jgi:Flp pilus assembly protein TadD
MSLIVDALRKAQRGASGRLPPLALKRPALTLPPGLAPRGIPKAWALGGLLVAGVVVAAGGAYLLRARPAAPRIAASLVVVEPMKSVAKAATPPASVTSPEAGTSIGELRAALGPDATPSGAPSPLPAPTPRSVSRPDPRRDVALERVRVALQDTKQPGQDSGASPGAAAPAAPVPTSPVPAPVAPTPAVSTPAGPAPAPVAATPPAVPSGPSTVQISPSESAPSTVLSIHPEGGKEATALFTAALRAHQQGRLDQAIEDYERSIAADPRNAAAFNNLGVALKDRGRLDEAAEAFQKALALDAKYEKALNNLGVIRFRKNQFEEAISLFKQALLINAGNVESHTNLGLIYLLAGRDDDALDAFQQALRVDPRLAEAHYNLGILWERRGNRDSAQRHYLKFVELAPDRHVVLVAKVKERLKFLARGR